MSSLDEEAGPPRRDHRPSGRQTRRLSDKILVAFHHACDQGDFEVAEYLLQVLEMMLKRRPRLVLDKRRRRDHDLEHPGGSARTAVAAAPPRLAAVLTGAGAPSLQQPPSTSDVDPTVARRGGAPAAGAALVDQARRALRLVLRVVPSAGPPEARSGALGAGAEPTGPLL